MWNRIHIPPEWFQESHGRNGPRMRGMESTMPKSSVGIWTHQLFLPQPPPPSSTMPTHCCILAIITSSPPSHHHHLHRWLPPTTSIAQDQYSKDDMAMPHHQPNKCQTHQWWHGGFRVPHCWLQHGKHMTNDDDVIVHCCCFYLYTMWVAHPPSSQPTLLTTHTLHYHYYTTPPLHYTTPRPHNHHHHHHTGQCHIMLMPWPQRNATATTRWRPPPPHNPHHDATRCHIVKDDVATRWQTTKSFAVFPHRYVISLSLILISHTKYRCHIAVDDVATCSSS